MLEKGTWHALQKDPCTKLLQAGQDFFCAFSVEGKDFGAPGNWDWYGGGAPAGGFMCFFPWFSYPDKLVVARKTPAGWSEWTVFDVETKFEIETFSMAADNSGTVHVLYKTKEGGDVNVDCECVYARIEPITPGRSSESRQLYNSDLGEKPRSQARVSGQAFSTTRNPDLGCYDIAVDPETGTGLMTVGGLYISNWFPSYSHIVQDGLISPQVRIPTVEYPHLEPAGKGRFHALAGRRIVVRPGYTIYYLVYDNGMWSAPVELGEGIDRFENIVLVSDLNRRALALWRKKKKRPVARWVELVE